MESKFQVATGAGYSDLASKVKMHQSNKMRTRSQNTYHIFRRVGKQGAHPSMESNQPGVKNCTTESATSLQK